MVIDTLGGRAPAPPGEAGAPRHAAAAQARLAARARAGLGRLQRHPRHREEPRPGHRLRGGGLPEHRRVLDQEPRHHDDHGRDLHARLRLLQRRHRQAGAARSRPSRPGSADAVAKMGLKHVVITSVDRDDLADGGAAHFAAVVRAIRAAAPGTTIEILTPGLPAQADGGGRDRDRRQARRLQPQPGDRAAALSRDPPGRALLPLAAPAGAGEGARSRRSSPSPA